MTCEVRNSRAPLERPTSPKCEANARHCLILRVRLIRPVPPLMARTWEYHQLRINKAPIPLLMDAYGHATQAQTLEYLCIQSEEIQELYDLAL